MRVFGTFPNDYSTQILIWDGLLFLFLVSITLFIEIMSRFSITFIFLKEKESFFVLREYV